MRIRLVNPANWISPRGRTHIAFPAGEHTVKREVGEDLVNRGEAEEIDPPTAVEVKAKKKGR